MNPTLVTAEQIAPLAVVVSITIGIVQLIKYADDTSKLARFYPLISFAVGMGLSIGIFKLDTATALVTSLSASGTYEVVKRTVLGVLPTTIPVQADTQALIPPPMGETAKNNNQTPVQTPVI